MRSIPEILRGAAALVRRGWHQGAAVDETGTRFCALGAIAKEMGDIEFTSTVMPAERILARALGRSAPYDASYRRCVAFWNDEKGQTAKNIAAGLELAAILAEQEQITTQLVAERIKA